ncbi:ATP-binding protein [Streptomyces sp. NPDC004065]|uniref:ATP-binding protein n=1 Tax=Streptomyces sp. NPDC004065 TaxID=3364689 RepID=UPI00384F3E44
MKDADQPNCRLSGSACRYSSFLSRTPRACAQPNSPAAEAGAEAIFLRLPRTARSVSVTRRHVGLAVRSWRAGSSLADRLLLVVSELVSNAVQHSALPRPASPDGVRPYIELALHLLGDHVRVEVFDAGHALPVHRPVGEYAESGRGMQIVRHCTRRWGADRLCAGGKIVWCDVALEENSSPQDAIAQAAGTGTPP